MTRILRATTGPDDWKALLADPDKHWRTGYSAKTTALSWEAASPDLPPEIAALLGPGAALQLAIVEHKVALPGGQRASQCDVFALVAADAGDIALAVEAKVDEPFGPTLGEWMATPTPGRQDRLAAIADWLDLADPDPGLRYQLLHRTAAAVAEALRFRRPVAAMMVQSFSPENRWFDDFARFAAALGLDAAPGQAARRRLPCGLDLILGWASGDQRFRQEVPA